MFLKVVLTSCFRAHSAFLSLGDYLDTTALVFYGTLDSMYNDLHLCCISDVYRYVYKLLLELHKIELERKKNGEKERLCQLHGL